MAEYQRLIEFTDQAPAGKRKELPPGSFGALVADYFASPEFKAKKPKTQRIYRLILEPLCQQTGHAPVCRLERRHVKAWRDARSDTPGMANMVVKVMRLLMAYGIENDYRKDNPAQRIKLFKLGEHRAWTDDECLAFELKWPSGTMQRRAYMLAKFTGQRCGDLARMTRAHRKGGAIRVIQEKTGAELWIAEHLDLAAELALGGEHMSLLTKSDGSAFDGNSLSPWFAGAIEETGLPDECVLHGLRKTAARMLAEAGCSAHEIMSVTGHKSLAEVQRYTSAASQRKLSTGAIHKVERNANRTASAKHAPSRLPNTKPTS